LTSDEIASRLAANSKLRAVYDQPRIAVSVREYDSHSIIVSGLVDEPGTKVLRREAIPLYVVIADAQPRPDARRALVTSRFTGLNTTVDLADHAAMNMLIHPGDVIKVEGQPKGQLQPHQFCTSAGLSMRPAKGVSSGHDFDAGHTVGRRCALNRHERQNIKAGDVIRWACRSASIMVRRDSRAPRGERALTTTKYKLEEIVSGKAPDPLLQPGDRIKVVR
jgi:protein involved in polysaccharide export with SLBB domain